MDLLGWLVWALFVRAAQYRAVPIKKKRGVATNFFVVVKLATRFVVATKFCLLTSNQEFDAASNRAPFVAKT